MLPYTISSHFYLRGQGLISCRFREISSGDEPTRGRKGLYITLISAYFRYFPIWSSFGELSSVIFGSVAVLPAVLRLLVVLILSDSVKPREGRLYMHIFIGNI